MRVLFTSTPGWGHIHPMVPLAQAFVDRGDEVLWAAAADVCVRLEREGFRASASGPSEQEFLSVFAARSRELEALPSAERPDFMFAKVFGTVRTAPMLADLMPLAETWQPTLVVRDAAEFAGPVAAAVVGVPSVTHAFGALLPRARVAAAGEDVAPLWTVHGLESRPYGGSYDHLYLDIYPPSLQLGDREHVPAAQLLRPGAFATAGDEPLPSWVTEQSSTPLVYVTFGTVFGNDAVLSMVIEAVRALPVRVVVTVGPKGDPASLGPQPGNVHVARYVPQGQLLGHCAAVFSHAGSGTFLAALAAGLPQLCLPQAADQFLNAAACEQSGTGLALQPEAVSAELIHTAVERLLSDTTFRIRAEEAGREIGAMPSPNEVADRLHTEYS